MNKSCFTCKKCGGDNLSPDPCGYANVDFVDDEGRCYFCLDCDEKVLKKEKLNDKEN